MDVATYIDAVRTPVAFFIFNRPDETRRVFEAIRGARPPKLLVIADAPRAWRPDDRAACLATRAIIDGVDWECEVLRNFADTNLGVPKRFASAFRWVFEHVDEAIFLEHDTLPHPDFFAYCEQLLARYRDEPRVMWIGGSNVWEQRFGDASYFINRTNAVWGWATWKRSWVNFDIEVRGFPEFKRQHMIERITPSSQMRAGFLALFDRAYHRQWDNWDAQSTFAIWSHDGLAIHPNVNLITNIGFGPQAENTRTATDPLANLPIEPLGPLIHPPDLRIRADVIEAEARFFDTHMGYALAMARRDQRFGRVPFYVFARGVLQRAARTRRRLLASRRWVKPWISRW